MIQEKYLTGFKSRKYLDDWDRVSEIYQIRTDVRFQLMNNIMRIHFINFRFPGPASAHMGYPPILSRVDLRLVLPAQESRRCFSLRTCPFYLSGSFLPSLNTCHARRLE